MTLRQQFAEILRQLPGFIAGAPARWLLRLHSPVDIGDGVPRCERHRHIVEWPCREWLDADASLATHPEWR